MRTIRAIIGTAVLTIGIIIYGVTTMVIRDIYMPRWVPGNSGDMTWDEWEVSQMKYYQRIEPVLPPYVQLSKALQNSNPSRYIITKFSLVHYLHTRKERGLWAIGLGILLLLWPCRSSNTKNKNTQQGGPAYPPQGVGSADP